MGENFSVRLDHCLNFFAHIQDNKIGGIVHCDFTPSKTLVAMNLSLGANKIITVPNAGGSSTASEALSFELLQKCFKANLLKTELEVTYFPEGGSITDYVCEIFGVKLGVSVTRAMKFRGGIYTEDDGVLQSNRNSLEAWNKQILHVWSSDQHITNILVHVYHRLPVHLVSNTVVLVTTTRTQLSNFIYKNR